MFTITARRFLQQDYTFVADEGHELPVFGALQRGA